MKTFFITENHSKRGPAWLIIFLEAFIWIMNLFCLSLFAIVCFLSIRESDMETLLIGTLPVLFFIMVDITFKQYSIETDIAVNIQREGIRVEYGNFKTKVFKWRELQEIAIIYEGVTRGKPDSPARTRICCVKKGGRKDFSGQWDYWSIFSASSCIVFDYSKEAYESLNVFCPMPIVDLRKHPEYQIMNWPFEADEVRQRIEFLYDYANGVSKSSDPEMHIVFEYMGYVEGAGHAYYFDAYKNQIDNKFEILHRKLPDDLYKNCLQAYEIYTKSEGKEELSQFDIRLREAKEKIKHVCWM